MQTLENMCTQVLTYLCCFVWLAESVVWHAVYVAFLCMCCVRGVVLCVEFVFAYAVCVYMSRQAGRCWVGAVFSKYKSCRIIYFVRQVLVVYLIGISASLCNVRRPHI